MASGLKVNINKSTIFGVGVEEEDKEHMASMVRCEAGVFPFSYLGLVIGANMNRSKHWSVIIDKFEKRLTNWKAENLSFGGRLTLVKSVMGSLPLFYFSMYKAPKIVIEKLEGIRRHFLWGGNKEKKKIHWVSWDMVTKSRERGGLGVNGLNHMNVALIAKWFWRLKTEKDSLWARCIKACHNLRIIDRKPVAKASLKGVWSNIVKCCNELKHGGIDLEDKMERRRGDGRNTHFWKDCWLQNRALKDEFPELYKIEKDKNCMVSERMRWDNQEKKIIAFWDWKRQIRRGREMAALHNLLSLTDGLKISDSKDLWRWKDGADGRFSVGKLRRVISEQVPVNLIENLDWINWIPLKVNCFVWRMKQGRIPVLCKLANRGVCVESKLCPVCQIEEEDVEHTFFRCCHAKGVWRWFVNWSGVMRDVPESFGSMVIEIKTGAGDKSLIKMGLALAYVVLWSIWKARNGAVFKKKKARSMNTAEEIQLISFNWIKYRAKRSRLQWSEWCAKPQLIM